MNIKELPFIHYLAEKDGGLVPASELDVSCGNYFVPFVPNTSILFDQYQFHYAIYKGNGEFEEIDGKKAIYTGIAEKIKGDMETPIHLLLMFGHQKSFIDDAGNIKLARLNVAYEKQLNYIRKRKHPDHKCCFVDLEHDKTLDYLLDTFGITMIGCHQEGKV